MTIFGSWILLISAIVFFFGCLKKLKLSCEPEWFLKYFKDYLLGYRRSLIVQNKIYEEGYDDDEYQPADWFIN